MNQYIDDIVYEVKNYDNNESSFFYLYKGTSDIVCSEIKKGNIWEKELSNFLKNNIKKTDIILEAGTHIGSHTVKICKNSNFVYGFEPYPLSYDLVNKNLKLNNLNNYKIFNKALSNENKLIKLEFHSPLARNVGGWGLYFESKFDDDNDIEVDCVTIDSLNFNKLDLIKLDVEGFEKDVLIGGIETIKKFKPIIIFENWDDNESIDLNNTIKKFDFLISIGYSINYLNGNNHNGCPDYVAKYTINE